MKTYNGIGLMSGTSLDGVDMAYCAFSVRDDGGWNYAIHKTDTRPYPSNWKKRLESLQHESAETYARTDVEYGHFLGSRLREFISAHSLRPDFIASHGHTIFHQPGKGFTGQIGDGETMAAYLPCPLVTNFRNKDLALKGQGAPLVPFGEKHLFPGCRLFLNLGGFSNITADGRAFDVSPCNFALNWAVKRIAPELEYDRDGDYARSGELSPKLYERLESLDYYSRPPPKSLGREWFEEYFLPIVTKEEVEPEDLLCTLCHHIASQLSRAITSTGIRDTEILITGGGARNTFLIDLLEEKLSAFGIALNVDVAPNLVDNKEALIFAFLGLQVLLGRPNILPSVTGASEAAVAGSIHLPSGERQYSLFGEDDEAGL